MNRTPTIEQFKLASARVQRHRLDNGLSVVLYADDSVPIVTSMMWYRVGSGFEELGTTGISHFLEHMMFKGSRGYAKGEIDYITTRNGGANNAFTSSDYTTYYFSFAADRWWPALEIEADRMQNVVFDPAEFELERQVILEELRMERDDPWNELRIRVEAAALGDHPYRFPIIGYQPDVEGLDLAALEAHYRRYYTPANAVLVAAGDLDPAAVLDRVEACFGGISPGRPASFPISAVPVHETAVRLEAPAQGRLERLAMAFPAPSLQEPEHYAFHLLDSVLVEGRLSRLHNRLVEVTPMAAYVSGDFADTARPGIYFLRLELLPGSRSELVEPILFEELRRLLQEGISEGELERAKNHCLCGAVSSFETTFDLAAQFGLTEVLGCPDYWQTYLERIESVTVGEVREIACRYLDPDRSVIGVSHRAR